MNVIDAALRAAEQRAQKAEAEVARLREALAVIQNGAFTDADSFRAFALATLNRETINE